MLKLSARSIIFIGYFFLSANISAGEWTNISIQLSAGPVIGTDELRGAERAYYSFTGGSIGPGNESTTESASSSTDGSILIDDQGTKLRFINTKARIIKQLAASTEYKLHERLALEFSSAISTSDSRYYFEDGIAPFLDPLTLTFSENRLTFKSGIAYRPAPIFALKPSIEAGILKQFQWSRTRIYSALIDVTDNHFSQDDGLYIDVSTSISDLPISAYVEVQRYSATDFIGHAGVRVSLSF